MKHVLAFFKKVGELKNIQRKGVLFYGVKHADSTTDHSFRLALMAWMFGTGRKLNMEKLLKFVLVHDICKVYAGDITPYEGLFPKKGENRYALAWRWRRLSLEEKEKRWKRKWERERKAMDRLAKNLPEAMRKELLGFWDEYHRMDTPEARFVYQLDRAENLIEALESFEENRKFPTRPWWEHADEVIHDSKILDFVEAISRAEMNIAKRKDKEDASS